MDLHGELTEVQERKDRQGLERRDFRLLAVTSLPGAASARKGEPRSGAAISGVRRGAPSPGGWNQRE